MDNQPEIRVSRAANGARNQPGVLRGPYQTRANYIGMIHGVDLLYWLNWGGDCPNPITKYELTNHVVRLSANSEKPPTIVQARNNIVVNERNAVHKFCADNGVAEAGERIVASRRDNRAAFNHVGKLSKLGPWPTEPNRLVHPFDRTTETGNTGPDTTRTNTRAPTVHQNIAPKAREAPVQSLDVGGSAPGTTPAPATSPQVVGGQNQPQASDAPITTHPVTSNNQHPQVYANQQYMLPPNATTALSQQQGYTVSYTQAAHPNFPPQAGQGPPVVYTPHGIYTPYPYVAPYNHGPFQMLPPHYPSAPSPVTHPPSSGCVQCNHYQPIWGYQAIGPQPPTHPEGGESSNNRVRDGAFQNGVELSDRPGYQSMQTSHLLSNDCIENAGVGGVGVLEESGNNAGRSNHSKRKHITAEYEDDEDHHDMYRAKRVRFDEIETHIYPTTAESALQFCNPMTENETVQSFSYDENLPVPRIEKRKSHDCGYDYDVNDEHHSKRPRIEDGIFEIEVEVELGPLNEDIFDPLTDCMPGDVTDAMIDYFVGESGFNELSYGMKFPSHGLQESGFTSEGTFPIFDMESHRLEHEMMSTLPVDLELHQSLPESTLDEMIEWINQNEANNNLAGEFDDDFWQMLDTTYPPLMT